jgi:hypothetical protein
MAPGELPVITLGLHIISLIGLDLLTIPRRGRARTPNDFVQIIPAHCPIRTRGAHTRAILPFLLNKLVGVLVVPGLLKLIGMLHTVPMEAITTGGQGRVSGTTTAVMITT